MRRYLLPLLLGLILSCAPAASAAVNTYLRPNSTGLVGAWSAVGAPAAWDALNDGVTEAQTPSGTDYVTTSTASTKLRVGLESLGIAGAQLQNATAWFYTSNSNIVSIRATNSETWTTFNTTGWHSIPVTLSGSQHQLDNLGLEFNSGSGTTSRVVQAAFLKLTLEPSPARVYWGARMDGDVKLLKEPPEAPGGDAPWDTATWNEFEADAGGKPVSIVHFGQPPPWTQEFAPKPLEDTITRGAIPLISMGTWGATLPELADPLGATVPLQKFSEWTKDVAAFEHPFFLRLNWEMNLESSSVFPWVSEARSSPATFIAAWRRMHNIAEQNGATNITWVWCPNVSYPGSTSLKSLFPGRAYVDWTCMDGYNWGSAPDSLTFSEVFTATYNEILALTDLSAAPPVMIGETASAEVGANGKPRWIADALGNEILKSFPKIKAFVWFNWNILKPGSESRLEWPIQTSKAARESFANAISSPFYASNSFGNLPVLEPVQPLP
jgi:hypothetical protein